MLTRHIPRYRPIVLIARRYSAASCSTRTRNPQSPQPRTIRTLMLLAATVGSTTLLPWLCRNKLFDDRAVGAMVPLAGTDKRAQRLGHAPQLCRAALELTDMSESNRSDPGLRFRYAAGAAFALGVVELRQGSIPAALPQGRRRRCCRAGVLEYSVRARALRHRPYYAAANEPWCCSAPMLIGRRQPLISP
jgi:hypothetical protein